MKAKRIISLMCALALMISMMSISALVSSAADATVTVSVTGTQLRTYAREVFEIVNTERKANGLSELEWYTDIESAAMLRAAENAVYYSHVRPDGTGCHTVITGGYRAFGENIAAGQIDPAEVMNDWMNSEGHRANILNTSFNSIVVGCFESNGTLFWVQLFSSELPTKTADTPKDVKDSYNIEVLESKLGTPSLNITSGYTLSVGKKVRTALRILNAGWEYPITPLDASCVNFTSSDTSVLKVDSDGYITGVKEGKATLTATVKGTSVSASADINVSGTEVKSTLTLYEKDFDADGYYWSFGSQLSMKVGTDKKFIIEISPEPADSTVSFATDKEGYVKWNAASRTLTPLKSGTVKCTFASVESPSATKTFTAVIESDITSITVSESDKTLNVGDTFTATVVTEPANPLDVISWTSSDSSVATVDSNGKITAVAEGTAVITASAGDIKANINVTVEDNTPIEYGSYTVWKPDMSQVYHNTYGVFANTAPVKYIDGRLFAPVRSGAIATECTDIIFDDVTGAISIKNKKGDTVKMQMESKKAKYIYADNTEKDFELITAPTYDAGNAYLPLRDLSAVTLFAAYYDSEAGGLAMYENTDLTQENIKSIIADAMSFIEK